MALPPPQGTFSCLRHWLLLVLVFLVVFVPLRSPSADEPPPYWTDLTDCPEARRWPIFCSALLNTTLLNDTAKRRVHDTIPRAKAFFCDMVRVLNKIDCAQPFTVSPKWRLRCQEAYRDWSCSLLAEGLLPVGLHSCDSTCHQVIRVCPYLSPDRVQVEASGKAALHPSQYGGHPAFHCPTTYTDSNHHHTEDYFFRRSAPNPDALVCILFNPSEAGLSPASFPLHSLDLRNFSVIYCQDYGNNHNDPHPLLTDKRGRVNVSQCCWTYDTALPRTYNALSSTLRRRVLEDENCVPLTDDLHEENPLHPPPDQENLKQVFLQCLVTQDTSSPPQEGYEYEIPFVIDYVDDDPPPAPPDPTIALSLNRISREDEDPPPDRFNSAEGEDYDEEDEEYDFPRASSTTEAFLALIASLDSSHLQTSTISNWRERRSLATDSPNVAPPSHRCPTRIPLLLFLLLVSLVLVPALLLSMLEWAEPRPSLSLELTFLEEPSSSSSGWTWVRESRRRSGPGRVHAMSSWFWAWLGELRRSQSPSTTPSTTTSIITSQGRSNEWRPPPRSYSLQRIT